MRLLNRRQESKMKVRSVFYKKGIPEEICEMISKFPPKLKIQIIGEKESFKEKRINEDADVYDWYSTDLRTVNNNRMWDNLLEDLDRASLGEINRIIENDVDITPILFTTIGYRSIGLRIIDKVDINLKDPEGGTILMNTVAHSNLKLTRKLIDSGARTDEVDYEKKTALIWSIEGFDINDNETEAFKVVEMMIKHSDKKTINKKDIFGKEALDYLIENYEERKRKEYKKLIKQLVKKA